MNLYKLSLLILATASLSGCLSGSDSSVSSSVTTQSSTRNTTSSTTQQTTNQTTQTTTSQQNTTTSSNNNTTTNNTTTSSNNNTTTSSNFLRLSMHYTLLLGQPHLFHESGGSKSLYLSEYAASGATSIRLNSTAGLIQYQLITYKGQNNQFYTTQISNIQNNTLQLSSPLQQAVYAGNNAWNFYLDGSHPNWAGSFAIADFAVRKIGWNRLNQGKHVLLGDSWFSRNTIFERLKSQLPNATISNKGTGGNTAWDLLTRFDADVSWQNPNYVWIMTGTNDYWQDITAANYKTNMRQLINRVRALGAVPIVFDSSVGPLNYGSDWKTRLSRSYVTAVDQLVAGN